MSGKIFPDIFHLFPNETNQHFVNNINQGIISPVSRLSPSNSINYTF